MTFLFLLASAVLVQTYLGYIFSLFMLKAVLGDRSRHTMGQSLPTVTLVISVYNEEAVLRSKIENSLALDYPPELLQRVVLSDGSTDRSDEIVREYADRGIQLQSFPGRRGKVARLNELLPEVQSQIIVLSDANSIYEPMSIRTLVRHFADPRVGCVCGALEYVNPLKLASGEGERFYWNYEKRLKNLESSLGSLLGANGAIYAFRTKLFRAVDPLMFCDDVIPIRISIDGYLTLYDPEARCTEESPGEGAEMRRRRRHASFGLRSMLRMIREAAVKRRVLITYQIVSHRIVRWLGGVSLMAALFSSPFLPVPWRVLAFGIQAIYYGCAMLGFVLSRTGRGGGPFYLAYYHLVISLAGMRGLVAFVRGSDQPHWEPRQ